MHGSRKEIRAALDFAGHPTRWLSGMRDRRGADVDASDRPDAAGMDSEVADPVSDHAAADSGFADVG